MYRLMMEWSELDVDCNFIKLVQHHLSFLHSLQDLGSSRSLGDLNSNVHVNILIGSCHPPTPPICFVLLLGFSICCSISRIMKHPESKNSLKLICSPTEVLFLWLIDPWDSGCHDTVPMSASGFWKMFYWVVFSLRVGFSKVLYLAKSWSLLFLYHLNLSL